MYKPWTWTRGVPLQLHVAELQHQLTSDQYVPCIVIMYKPWTWTHGVSLQLDVAELQHQLTSDQYVPCIIETHV